jgi:hypothetical protein
VELRNRLTRSAARMRTHLDLMVDDLPAHPTAIGTPILAAWSAKEDLLDPLGRTNLWSAPYDAHVMR